MMYLITLHYISMTVSEELEQLVELPRALGGSRAAPRSADFISTLYITHYSLHFSPSVRTNT